MHTPGIVLSSTLAPGALEATPRKATAHRALDDIRESIEELRWYRAHVFKPAGPLDPPVK